MAPSSSWNNANAWRSFGNEFGKALNDIEHEMKSLPRQQRMSLWRAIRKGYAQQEKQHMVPAVTGTKRRNTNNQKTSTISKLWKPRK